MDRQKQRGRGIGDLHRSHLHIADYDFQARGTIKEAVIAEGIKPEGIGVPRHDRVGRSAKIQALQDERIRAAAARAAVF
jgi:hypothetical protein